MRSRIFRRRAEFRRNSRRASPVKFIVRRVLPLILFTCMTFNVAAQSQEDPGFQAAKRLVKQVRRCLTLRPIFTLETGAAAAARGAAALRQRARQRLASKTRVRARLEIRCQTLSGPQSGSPAREARGAAAAAPQRENMPQRQARNSDRSPRFVRARSASEMQSCWQSTSLQPTATNQRFDVSYIVIAVIPFT